MLYTQDKLNKILNSDSPLNYLRQQENAFENEAYTFSKKTNPKQKVENKNIPEIISNEDLSKFQNEGVVDEKILAAIANKIKNGIALSDNENQIFTDKTTEINDLLIKIKQNEEQLKPILNPEEQELPVVEKPVIKDEIEALKQQNIKEKEEIIEEEEFELDNIESKQYEAVFLIDENGNILEGEDNYNERSKDLIN